MTTHADEARRIVDAMKTCQTNHPEKWLEPIAAALAAAERAGIERCATTLLATADEPQEIRLHCGELTSVELRYTQAVLRWAASSLRALLPAAAEPAAKSLQDEIGAWGDVTFPNSTQQTIIAHLRSEVNEEIAPDCDPEELADAAMLVMQLAHKRKLNLDALVRAKFEKNKRRKWVWDEKAGFSRHVKEAEPAAKCATCKGTGKVIKMNFDELAFPEYDPCPSCSGGAK